MEDDNISVVVITGSVNLLISLFMFLESVQTNRVLKVKRIIFSLNEAVVRIKNKQVFSIRNCFASCKTLYKIYGVIIVIRNV